METTTVHEEIEIIGDSDPVRFAAKMICQQYSLDPDRKAKLDSTSSTQAEVIEALLRKNKTSEVKSIVSRWIETGILKKIAPTVSAPQPWLSLARQKIVVRLSELSGLIRFLVLGKASLCPELLTLKNKLSEITANEDGAPEKKSPHLFHYQLPLLRTITEKTISISYPIQRFIQIQAS